MSRALDEFRAQREAVEGVHARLTEVADLLRGIRAEAAAVARDENLRNLLREEQTWLVRAHDLLREVGHFRERETSRFWLQARMLRPALLQTLKSSRYDEVAFRHRPHS